MHILVTGGAGFIGAALCARLLERGDRVLAIDNLSDYYDVGLKQSRLQNLRAHDAFEFRTMDIAARDEKSNDLFAAHNFDAVVHLAAQAGVRYSLDNPDVYVDSNLVGFANILQGCRHAGIAHLIYASSSSVYGANTKLPFAERDATDQPVSLYGATKKANELMAHAYAHLYDLPCTGLRFFTVYGPWGRPDMAFFKFAELMLRERAIPVYNHGDLTRDFTYIDDTVECIVRVIDAPPQKTRHKIYNIGNGGQVKLMDYIHALEGALGIKARYEMLPMQDGDVAATRADTTAFAADFGFTPSTSIEHGLATFAAWYRDYYRQRDDA